MVKPSITFKDPELQKIQQQQMHMVKLKNVNFKQPVEKPPEATKKLKLKIRRGEVLKEPISKENKSTMRDKSPRPSKCRKCTIPHPGNENCPAPESVI